MALKRVQLSIPAGHDLSGLTFVIRSADSTAWWRDGVLQANMHHSSLPMLMSALCPSSPHSLCRANIQH